MNNYFLNSTLIFLFKESNEESNEIHSTCFLVRSPQNITRRRRCNQCYGKLRIRRHEERVGLISLRDRNRGLRYLFTMYSKNEI